MAFYSHTIASALPVQVPQFMIYHTDGSRMVVKLDEYTEKLNSGEWFLTPLDAENALNARLEKGSITQMIAGASSKGKKQV